MILFLLMSRDSDREKERQREGQIVTEITQMTEIIQMTEITLENLDRLGSVDT